jgi:23S rRNA (uracil747-C5)-methyltransferase
MLRFVLRSAKLLGRIREHLGLLLRALPGLRVVTANLQPEHQALSSPRPLGTS